MSEPPSPRSKASPGASNRVASAGKSNAQLKREQREAEQVQETRSPRAVSSPRSPKVKKTPQDEKSKAQLKREQREVEAAVAAADTVIAAEAEKAKANARKGNESPRDPRSTTQKERDDREHQQEAAKSKEKDSSRKAAALNAKKGKNVANSKTKTKSGSVTQDGLEIIDELCDEEDPVEVAEWFLSQLKKVSKTDDVETLPLYKLACAFMSASHAQRKQRIKAAFDGYGMMDPEKRAEVLIMVVKSAAVNVPPSRSDPDTKHVANLRIIVKAARFDQMEAEQRANLLKTVQAEVLKYIGPQHLSEALVHLNDEERKQLTAALVKSNLLPPDQEALVQEIVEPDGILEEVGTASNIVSKSKDFILFIVLLPVAEWACAKRWLRQKEDCADSLNQWLLVDGFLSLASVALIYVICAFLEPAYDVLCSDPVGTMRKWKKSRGSGAEFEERLLGTFQVDTFAVRVGSASVGFLMLVSVISAVYAAWAVYAFLGVFTVGCIESSVIFIAIVLALRAGLIVWIAYMAARVWDLMRRHNLIDPGGAADSSYGSMQDSRV